MHLPQAENSAQNPTLQLMCARALMAAGGTAAAIALAHGGSMICRASVGVSAPPLGCLLDTSSGFSGVCVRSGRTLRCDDSEIDLRVDVESCRLLGIRSILAAPIFRENKVVGLLEVFSQDPFAFDSSHVAAVEHLANTIIPEPPASQDVSLRRERSQLPSPPGRFWADVFVPSGLPWNRFSQSMLLHVIVIVVLGSILQFSPLQGPSVKQRTLTKADVVYYSRSRYIRSLRTGSSQQSISRIQPDSAQPRVVAVSAEPRGHEQDTAAPEIKLNREMRLLQLVSSRWVAPAVPWTATAHALLHMSAMLVAVVGPPPDFSEASGSRAITSLRGDDIIGPPPDVSAGLRSRALDAQQKVVGPPPQIRGFGGHIGGESLSAVEVIPPAPQMRSRQSGISRAVTPGGIRGAMTSVVPPSPSMTNVRGPVGQRTNVLSDAALRVTMPADPAAGEPNSANSRSVPEADQVKLGDTKELSVDFVGLALALPSSSYFRSQEIFIAQSQLSRYTTRLIKLVYEYLPYQTRLSEYGPNYPAVDKLRVTRDTSCDETLMQLMSGMNVAGRPQYQRLAQQLLSSNGQTGLLECYRTTAEDYRKAQAHRR